MPCIFDIKPENRNCRYCVATLCDERQPKPVETYTTSDTTNKAELWK